MLNKRAKGKIISMLPHIILIKRTKNLYLWTIAVIERFVWQLHDILLIHIEDLLRSLLSVVDTNALKRFATLSNFRLSESLCLCLDVFDTWYRCSRCFTDLRLRRSLAYLILDLAKVLWLQQIQLIHCKLDTFSAAAFSCDVILILFIVSTDVLAVFWPESAFILIIVVFFIFILRLCSCHLLCTNLLKSLLIIDSIFGQLL